jgi:DNA-binding response OmpR family regulator
MARAAGPFPSVEYDAPVQQILVIEDDSELRTPLVEFLRLSGYEVFEAENGNRGLEIFDSRPIDLVLTDIIMPEKEGLETIIDLKKRNPRLKIMAMSGDSSRSSEYLTYARRFGADRIVPKPFDFEVLVATIQEVLAS